MILEWLIKFAATIVSWIAGLFPPITLPGWITSLDARVNGWFGQWDGVGVWVDWTFITGCLVTILAVWGIGFVIKLIRVILGHIPQFGGNG